MSWKTNCESVISSLSPSSEQTSSQRISNLITIKFKFTVMILKTAHFSIINCLGFELIDLSLKIVFLLNSNIRWDSRWHELGTVLPVKIKHLNYSVSHPIPSHSKHTILSRVSSDFKVRSSSFVLCKTECFYRPAKQNLFSDLVSMIESTLRNPSAV